MSALPSHVIEEIKALPAQFPDLRTAVMPALDLAQEELGHLNPEAMSEVAGALNLDPGYVEGVATFYTLFHTEPVGKHRMYLCTNISCKLLGADELLDETMRMVGVRDQTEVSKDGLFSVEPVECLGACEYAPVMRLDHAYHYDLTVEKIQALVEERRSGRLPAREQPVSSAATLPAAAESAPPAAAVQPPARKPRAPRKKKEAPDA